MRLQIFTRQGDASYTTVGLQCTYLGMTEGPRAGGTCSHGPPWGQRGCGTTAILEASPGETMNAHRNWHSYALPSLSRFGHSLGMSDPPCVGLGSMSAPPEATTVLFRSTHVLLGHSKTPAGLPLACCKAGNASEKDNAVLLGGGGRGRTRLLPPPPTSLWSPWLFRGGPPS